MAASRPLTVSELNRQARQLLEVSFMHVLVEGELSNFVRPGSGHWYFALKDDKAQVRCAMFRNRNQAVRTPPREGDQVMVRAKVSLYESRGDYQLLVESIEPAGLGALQRAFEALKAKLEKEGLFAAERKRPLPAQPRRIGVVTSATGAAVHDILTVLQRRFPAIEVYLYPTLVQGSEAAPQIVRAIERANAHRLCDVLIVGRGGGSLEDLWPFNEETVARAIAASELPVVSAVGHEVDVTIADLVADWRAPTPSAAAEHLSPDGRQWQDRFEQLEERLVAAQTRRLRALQDQLSQLARRLQDPRRQLQERAQRLDDLELRLHGAWRQQRERRQTRLDHLRQRLALQSPDGRLKASREQLQRLGASLNQAMNHYLEHRRQGFELVSQKLHLVSPLATLGRGYAIVGTPEHPVLRDATSVRPGDSITARLARGRLNCTVDAVEDSGPDGPASF